MTPADLTAAAARVDEAYRTGVLRLPTQRTPDQWVVCFCTEDADPQHPSTEFMQRHNDKGEPLGPLWRATRAQAVSDRCYAPGTSHIVVRLGHETVVRKDEL